jgi:hypothetical protein
MTFFDGGGGWDLKKSDIAENPAVASSEYLANALAAFPADINSLV